MIALAFLNAAFRERVLSKRFSDIRAHQVSTLTLMLLCGLYGVWVFRFLDIRTAAEAWTAGTYWAVLTVVFEFSLGKLLRRSWKQLIGQYNRAAGHLWPLFLVFLFLLPYLLCRLS